MKKILIIRFSSIGDIVLTTPVVRCLKQQVKDSEIHYLTKEQFYPVLQANPYIDKIHLMRGRLEDVLPDLVKHNFDFIVDLHKNFRSLSVRRKLKAKAASFDKLNYQKWLVVNFKINKLPDVHIVDRYFQAVEPLGVKNDGKGLDYFIPAQEEVCLSQLPDFPQEDYLGLVIGAKHETKIFPVEKIIELLELIDEPVLLLGGKEDRQRGDEIISKSDKQIYNACGEFSINQSASLLRQAKKIVTNDTGLMHIAAAFKKEIISLWGNTIPEFGMYPYLPDVEKQAYVFEMKKLKCRPCSKLGYRKCPKGHFRCMNELDVNSIAEAIKS